ncbi:MAG: RidA family protein [Armatimonadetes bacterium]|nr:RidA family protein [Armatimonadota bacterium]
MSDRKRISGPSPYEKSVGFSRAVRVGDQIYVSGTAPIGEDGQSACPGDPYGQTLRCLEIIRQALEEAGSRIEDVVRTRIFITDRADFGPVCRAHAEVFGEIRPASTLVIVERLLEEEWLVEIEAEAVASDA